MKIEGYIYQRKQNSTLLIFQQGFNTIWLSLTQIEGYKLTYLQQMKWSIWFIIKSKIFVYVISKWVVFLSPPFFVWIIKNENCNFHSHQWGPLAPHLYACLTWSLGPPPSEVKCKVSYCPKKLGEGCGITILFGLVQVSVQGQCLVWTKA